MPSKVDERIDSLLADWSRATSPDTGGCRLHVGPSRLSRCRSATHSACRLWWLPTPVLALIGTASAACTGCLCPLPPATTGTRSGTRGELVCPRHEGRSSGRGRVAAARPERGQRGNGSVSVDCTAGLECGGLGDSPAPPPSFLQSFQPATPPPPSPAPPTPLSLLLLLPVVVSIVLGTRESLFNGRQRVNDDSVHAALWSSQTIPPLCLFPSAGHRTLVPGRLLFVSEAQLLPPITWCVWCFCFLFLFFWVCVCVCEIGVCVCV